MSHEPKLEDEWDDLLGSLAVFDVIFAQFRYLEFCSIRIRSKKRGDIVKIRVDDVGPRFATAELVA
jgi:hypothetical protein